MCIFTTVIIMLTIELIFLIWAMKKIIRFIAQKK